MKDAIFRFYKAKKDDPIKNPKTLQIDKNKLKIL